MPSNDQDSGQQAGAGGEPTQPIAASGDQPISDENMETFVSALIGNPLFIGAIDERAERQWKSGKDRRIGKLTDRQDDLESVVAKFTELTSGGMSSDDALHRMQVDRFMGQQEPGEPAPQSEPGGSGTGVASVDITASLKVLGLDANDPKVVEMLRGGKDSPADFVQLAISRQSQTTSPPNPAGVMPTGGGGGGTDDQTADAIVARMQVLQQNPTKENLETLKELDKKLADLM